MTDRDPDEPAEDAVEGTEGDTDDVITPREADGETLPADSPSAGVVDEDLADPPEPSEPA